MTKQRLKIVFIVIWLVGVLFLALPTFSFNIGDQTIKVNYSDRLSAKLKTPLGNFQRSFGSFETHEIKANLSFTNTELPADQKLPKLLSYLDLVNKRIEAANLYDVKIRAQVQDDQYSLIFSYPQYYSNPEEYTQWLIAQAKITFYTADQDNPQQIDLNDYDILGSVNLDYLDTIGSHLIFRTTQDKITTTESAFSSNKNGAYFLMNIDSLPAYFVIQYDQYKNTNEDLVRLMPTQAITLNSVKERNDYLNITRSYFLAEALTDSFGIDGNVAIIKPIFREDSATLIAEMFILSAVLLAIVFLNRFKWQGFVKYSLSLAVFTLTFVAALKILSSNLSISFLLGFIFVFILVNALLYYILETKDSEDNVKKNLRLVRDLSIFGFILLAVIYKLVPNLNVMADFIGVTLIGFIVLFVMAILHFKFIIEMPVFKLPKFRRLKNETTK